MNFRATDKRESSKDQSNRATESIRRAKGPEQTAVVAMGAVLRISLRKRAYSRRDFKAVQFDCEARATL